MGIENLTLDELYELNELICNRIDELKAQQNLEAMMKLRLGQEVHFDSQHGPVFGKVIKINRKTIIVKTEDNRQWKIPAGMASPIKDID